MSLAWRHGIDNIRFSIWNVLQQTTRRFDLVCSTEMLEHIEMADVAARNIRQAASKYVYCLVPFADQATNADQRRRKDVLDRFQHYVAGYDAGQLTALFPNPVKISGTYWPDAGQAFRRQITAMQPHEIKDRAMSLAALAEADLRDDVPRRSSDCLGIKIISAL
jgi:hypothetical protein